MQVDNTRLHSEPASSADTFPREYGPQVTRWILRSLLHPRAFRKVAQAPHCHEELLSAMGLESLADGEVDRQFMHATLKWAYDNLGRKRSKPQEIFSSNIKRLSTLLDLSPAEQLLLQFLASVQEAKALEDSTDLFGDLSRHKLMDVLHHILRLRRTEIVRTLSRSGSLHLAGLINVQPGSGKTAFAHYLAQRLDKTLIRKDASELLSMWVGETEKNLVRMFRQARSESGLLLLDEADSFLQDRPQAHHSWEVTQVNELLVQMEAFDGLFLCSTNLMQALDTAVLRRFDLKIHFHYLKAEHAWSLFEDLLAALQVPLGESHVTLDLQHRLQRLDTLTPGDFAMTLRQAKLLGCPSSAEQLLTALEVECRAKQRGSKPVLGFSR